jgi:hypothetical protein
MRFEAKFPLNPNDLFDSLEGCAFDDMRGGHLSFIRIVPQGETSFYNMVISSPDGTASIQFSSSLAQFILEVAMRTWGFQLAPIPEEKL